MTYHKAFQKTKTNANNTGFYRVTIHKTKQMKKGYRFVYSINNEVLKVNIAKKNLYDLKLTVIENNLQWFIIDKDKALETCIKEEINPVLMNSNVTDKYINYKFNYEDIEKYIHEIYNKE